MKEDNSFQRTILFLKSGFIYTILLLLFVILLVDSISSIDGIANPQLLQREYYYFYPELFDELPESIQESVDENIDASIEHDQNHWMPVTEEEFGLMGDSDMETPYLMEELYLVQDDIRDMKTKLKIIGNETGGLQDEYGKCEPPPLDEFVDPCASLPPGDEDATLENCNEINPWCETVEKGDASICQAKWGDEADPDRWCNEEYEKAGGIVRSACPNICEYVKDGSRDKGTGENIEATINHTLNLQGTCVEVDSTDEWLEGKINSMISDSTLPSTSIFRDLFPDADVYNATDVVLSTDGVITTSADYTPINPSLCVLMSDDEDKCNATPGCFMPDLYYKRKYVIPESCEGDPEVDCNFTSGDSTTCGEGCVYTDETEIEILTDEIPNEATEVFERIDNTAGLCLSNGSEDDECTAHYTRRGGHIVQNCPFTCKYNSSDSSESLQGEFGLDITPDYRLPQTI